MEVICVLNISLFWEDFRENKKLWLTFSGLMLFFSLVSVGFYALVSGSQGNDGFATMPVYLTRLLGFDTEDKSLTGFLSSTLYEVWFLILPLIYSMVLSKRLVAEQMERRTMIYYVGSPLGRKKVIFTQGYFLLFSLFVMIGVGAFGTALFSKLFFPGELESPQFLLLNIGIFSLHAAMSGIGFFFSCVGKNKNQVFLGEAIVLFFLAMYLFGRTWKIVSFLRYFSLVSLFDGTSALNGSLTLLIRLPLLALIGGGLYWLGMFFFQRMDLSLAGKHHIGKNRKGL